MIGLMWQISAVDLSFIYRVLLFLMILLIISYLSLLVCVLVSVAFYTLLERRVLGYIQIRKGPNKVGFIGLLQPFSDGIKLITREQVWPLYANRVIFYVSPIVGLFISLSYWGLGDLIGVSFFFQYGVMFFLVLSSLGVYSILGVGWGSNSIYSTLGCYRAVAQTISYEVRLALILLGVVVLVGDYNLVSSWDFSLVKLGLLSLLLWLWILSCLAETNRSPFDFAEGESELVSGFNIEYGAGGFALIFISEYANIIFMSLISCYLFLSFNLLLGLMSVIFFFLWVRGAFPRYRYDKLMMLAWRGVLPFVLGYFIFLYGVLLLCNKNWRLGKNFTHYFVRWIELNLGFK